jgi:uncharacterized coiled-coil DUF342 family protein
MIDETLSRLETKLRDGSRIDTEHRDELLSLLRELKAELAAIQKTQSAEARQVTGHTERFAKAVTEERDPELLQRTLQELDSFENSHPQLVHLVNRIATTLSSLGI